MTTGTKIAIGSAAFLVLGGLTYYFVFIKPKSESAPEGVFSEIFYDNDWVDGGEIGFLVQSPTKFQFGDTVKVKQFKGASVPQYDGTWTVKNIVFGKKKINGITYDAVQTNAAYVKDTPVNGGTITKL
jgi:hypothetical protein